MRVPPAAFTLVALGVIEGLWLAVIEGHRFARILGILPPRTP